MSRSRQIISCFLALCLAVAGAVGLNPALHRWMEHGGHGPSHTHLSGLAHTSAHLKDTRVAHDHAGHHAHDRHNYGHVMNPGHRHATRSQTNPTRGAARGLWAHSPGAFASPTDSLAKLRKALANWLRPAPAAQDTSAPREGGNEDLPDHQHVSLAQSLVGGLIEPTVDLPLLQFEFELKPSQPLPAQTIRLPKGFDAQSASRGPPHLRA